MIDTEKCQLSEIQRRLREAIKQSNIKQKEIAVAIGVSAKTVSAYMHRDVFPALDTFARLCDFIGVPYRRDFRNNEIKG